MNVPWDLADLIVMMTCLSERKLCGNFEATLHFEDVRESRLEIKDGSIPGWVFQSCNRKEAAMLWEPTTFEWATEKNE